MSGREHAREILVRAERRTGIDYRNHVGTWERWVEARLALAWIDSLPRDAGEDAS